MPRVVDPDVRRRAVADAALGVVARDGVENASLRNVAHEAGLAVGSVRHYFDTQADMLRFAMSELEARITGRVTAHLRDVDAAAPVTPGSLARRVLAELLPLDEHRRLEAAVWFAFVAAAQTREHLAPVAVRSLRGIRALVRRVLQSMRDAGSLSAAIDVDEQVEHTAALLDGLTLAAVVDPGSHDADSLLGLLDRHLDHLTDRATTT